MSWTESRTESRTNSNGERETVTHRDYYGNSKEYFSQTAVLWGNPLNSNADAPTMPAGAYSLPFNFLLPHYIPQSFEGRDKHQGVKCHVRYTCKATIGMFGTFTFGFNVDTVANF